MTSHWYLRSAIELPLPRLAEIFAAAFEGYFVPVGADVDAFARRVRSEHVDLAASLVAFERDAPVGIALVARRGTTARIAAMGIVTAARTRGLGRILVDATLEQARARGERRMILEVIEENHAARVLYERAGFMKTRRLVGFRAPPLATAADVQPALEERPLDELVRMYTREAEDDLPWQIAPATIAAATPPTQAFALGSALALVDISPATVVLRALVVPLADRRAGRAMCLVRALQARFCDRALRAVPIIPEAQVGSLPARVGAVLDEMAQLELARDL